MTDVCQFFALFVLNVLISWHRDVSYACLFLVVNQHDVRPIVK